MSNFDVVSDLKIGHIVEVSGTAVKVELDVAITELTRTFGGRVYPIGQIGSVVKIHFGRRLIFGFVTLLRMRSEELIERAAQIPYGADQRVMEIELFGEGVWSLQADRLQFMRGVATYPLPRQEVFLLTQDEIVALYKSAEKSIVGDEINPLVPFANYVGADNAVCRANIDRMFGMHCAVLGSTGAGKSGAVAAILHSVLEHAPDGISACKPSIVMIDPHGEYGRAFTERAVVYRAYDPIGTEESTGDPIALPYWLMSADEFRRLVIGKTEFEATSQNNVIYKALTHARMAAAGIVDEAPKSYGINVPNDGRTFDEPRPKLGKSDEDIVQFDRDKPRPFKLEEFYNHIYYLQAARPTKTGASEQVTASEFADKYKSILDKLGFLRRDPRIAFMMKEYDTPELTVGKLVGQLVGAIEKDGFSRDLRILDISGLPNEVAGPLAAMVARLLFQYKLHQDAKQRERDPVLLVCEEAHRYVPDRGEAEYTAAQAAIRRIAREGRKYGIGLMLVSQRPSDVEGTVISQCGTWLVLRLTNSADQSHVAKFLPDGLSGMTKSLPSLAQQEALFVGEGAALPARVRIRDLSEEKLPKSSTVKFAYGWSVPCLTEEEIDVVGNRMSGEG